MPSLFKEISGLLDNASNLLTAEFTRETDGLIRALASVVTPDLLKGIYSLLTNANVLLAPASVKEVNGRLGNVSNLLTLDSVNKPSTR